MSQNHRIDRIVRAALSDAWYILPSKFEAVVEILSRRAQGERLSAAEIADVTAGPQTTRISGGDGIAVIGLTGIIAHRAAMVDDISGPGGTSIETFRRQFRAAMASNDVAKIVLDVDTPGGTVAAVPEMAAEIRAATATKPVIAVANSLAASAGYLIASAASEVVVIPSGLIGSVGVVAAHADFSKMDDERGVTTTLISAGEGKTDGNEFEPLSKRAHADIQARVDAFYTMIVDGAVAGRNGAGERPAVTAALVRDVWKARVVTAVEAVEIGMADRVETLDETLERLGAGPQRADSQAAAAASERQAIAAEDGARRRRRRLVEAGMYHANCLDRWG